jgi:hypothetical protein
MSTIKSLHRPGVALSIIVRRILQKRQVAVAHLVGTDTGLGRLTDVLAISYGS